MPEHVLFCGSKLVCGEYPLAAVSHFFQNCETLLVPVHCCSQSLALAHVRLCSSLPWSSAPSPGHDGADDIKIDQWHETGSLSSALVADFWRSSVKLGAKLLNLLPIFFWFGYPHVSTLCLPRLGDFCELSEMSLMWGSYYHEHLCGKYRAWAGGWPFVPVGFWGSARRTSLQASVEQPSSAMPKSVCVVGLVDIYQHEVPNHFRNAQTHITSTI